MTRPVRVAHLDTAVPAEAGTALSASRWSATADGVEVAGDDAGRRHGVDTLTALRGHAPEAGVCTIAVAPDGPVVVRLLRALTWSVQEGADIVSISLGLPGDNIVLAPVLARLWRAGTLVVAAAGNRGPGRLSQPAADPHVLAVGACNDAGRVQRYSGSSVPAAGVSLRPDVLAASPDGTSAACARVSGVAAALLARHRSAGRTAHDVAVALQLTAHPLGDPDRSRAAAGQVDEGAADALLAGGAELPRRRPAIIAAGEAASGTRYVDPRLQWLLDAGDPAQVVRSVAAIDGETVVLDERRDAYVNVLADPRVTAVSAPDVPAWTLTCTEALINGTRLIPVVGQGAEAGVDVAWTRALGGDPHRASRPFVSRMTCEPWGTKSVEGRRTLQGAWS